ncbi:MAG: hypothetical protein J6A01_09630 [Proteobacteria bacterium]|nr:hypothetical protein [Pseudomonadota bacterium]
MKRLSLIIAIITALLIPLTALAQDESSEKSTSPDRERVSYSIEQIMLNNEALEAIQTGNYSRAEHLYNAILSIQENNFTWLELGQTYARLNKCIEAYDAYHHVATAPILDDENSTPEIINEATQKALVNLDAQCSAKAIFYCDPEDTILSIDGGKALNCSKKQIPLVPGMHTVYAQTSYSFDTKVFELQSNQTTDIKIRVVDYSICNGYVDVSQFPDYYIKRTFAIAGWSLLGSGVALTSIGTGLLFADDINGNKANNKIAAAPMITPGSAAIMAGIGLLIANGVNYSPLPVDYNNPNLYDDCDCNCEYKGYYIIADQYKKWGWGLFGSGLGLVAIGTGLYFADDMSGNKDNNKIAMASLVSLGGAAVITGISLLLVNSIKFSGLYSLQYFPEFFVSPQMIGLGISDWF